MQATCLTSPLPLLLVNISTSPKTAMLKSLPDSFCFVESGVRELLWSHNHTSELLRLQKKKKKVKRGQTGDMWMQCLIVCPSKIMGLVGLKATVFEMFLDILETTIYFSSFRE